MNTKSLKDLAIIIGWKLVNDDKDFSIYEFIENVNKFEKLSHIIKIAKDVSNDEVYEIWLTLKSVLPKRLRRKLVRITKNVQPENFASILEVVNFTIEEYKAKTDYEKIREYGRCLGINIDSLGFEFEYNLPKTKQQELISIIESKLPIEIAPIVGKMKKIDYKIGYVKQKKLFAQSEE